MTTTTSYTPLLRAGVLALAGIVFVAAGFYAFNGGSARDGGGSDGFDFAAMSDSERGAFRAEVRTFLMENPEVIMEAVAVLEERERAEAAQADAGLIRAHAETIFEDGYSHIAGNPEGDITIVEFVDYRCGYCRRAHGDVQELVSSDGNIRLVTKEFPILGPNSMVSSQFAIAVKQVAGPEAYAAAYDLLITLNAEMTEPALRRLAETLDVDADAVLAAMQSDAVREEIRQTRALAQQLNISGTPTFVLGSIDGESEMLRGYVPLDGMRRIVAEVREAG